MNTVSRRIHKHLRPRASSRKQMFMGRSSKQCIVNWSLWLFSSVDSWFPGHRPLRGRGMASLKQVQLLTDANVQTGSFMITATYSPQSERTRAGAHERAHTSGCTRMDTPKWHTQLGTHKQAHMTGHTRGQRRWAGPSRPYFILEHLCLPHPGHCPSLAWKHPFGSLVYPAVTPEPLLQLTLLTDRSRSPRAHHAG